MKLGWSRILLIGVASLFSLQVWAVDPPHATCGSCHILHNAPGAQLTAVNGNANLCMSCHQTGGTAAAKPLANANQALPGPGLAGANASGNAHRWDSGPAGHVNFGRGAATASTGKIIPGGAYTGPYPKTYTITITTAGSATTARFSWVATTPPGGTGTNLTAGTSVVLDQGVTVTFANGTGAPSFQLNDKWYLYVRPNLNSPTTTDMQVRAPGGVAMCSTCHDQHSQAHTPFDPSAPAYSGGGSGRHYQRVENGTDQACKDCHSRINVTSATQGSHAVGVAVPNQPGKYKAPITVPLSKASNVECETCHKMHHGPTSDGTLRRVSSTNALCTDCHTLADTVSPGSHMNTTSGVLWPGGQYGSTFPAITDTTKRGTCSNCHQTHGWPDNAAPTQHYPKLLVESQPNVCFTCHDGSPASNQMTDFAGTIWATAAVGTAANTNLNTHHDVKSTDQTRSGAVMKCSNCHDVHASNPSAKTIADPDPSDGRVPTAGRTWVGSDLQSEWCLDCHDGSFPSTIIPPTKALANVRTSISADAHGTVTGNASLKAGYGWAKGDVVPCTACHDFGHGSTNLFQLKTTIYSKDGTKAIPSDAVKNGPPSSTVVAVTDNNSTNAAINAYQFCNTCHTGSMGANKTNCFSCHYHGSNF